MARLFQQTLTIAASRSFLSLEYSKTKTWEDNYIGFNRQYKYNTRVDVNKKDLKTNK